MTTKKQRQPKPAKAVCRHTEPDHPKREDIRGGRIVPVHSCLHCYIMRAVRVWHEDNGLDCDGILYQARDVADGLAEAFATILALLSEDMREPARRRFAASTRDFETELRLKGLVPDEELVRH
jgi:hypothetical protein